MKRIIRAFCAALFTLCVFASLQLCALAADYEDGTYTVPFSMSGLGRHNIAWNTATVEVENGSLYVTFTLERVDPRDHAPQYDWLETSLGQVTPTINDEAFTCTFSHVPVPSLGEVEVSVQTSAMSQPYAIDYTINIDGSGIPLKAEETPVPTPVPTPETAPEPADAPDAPEEMPAPAEPADDPIAAAPAENGEPAEDIPARPSPTPGVDPVETATPAENPASADDAATNDDAAPADDAAPIDPKPEADEPDAAEAPAPAPDAAEGHAPQEVSNKVGPMVALLAALVAIAGALIVVMIRKGKGK